MMIKFPRTGLTLARAVENYGEPVRLEFLNPETDEVIASFPAAGADADAFVPESSLGISGPFLRFHVLRVAGLPEPLVLSVAVTPGGSDCGFYASVIGEVGGRLRTLTPEALDTEVQGGLYVGDLGGGRGPGAAVWSAVWDFDSEGHYGPHRYEVKLYPFDGRRKKFRRGEVLKSRRKHEGEGEGALAELGLSFPNLLGDIPHVSLYQH